MRVGRYAFSMELREPSDLTNIPFDEFVSLIFVRDMPPEAGTPRSVPWLWSLAIKIVEAWVQKRSAGGKTILS